MTNEELMRADCGVCKGRAGEGSPCWACNGTGIEQTRDELANADTDLTEQTENEGNETQWPDAVLLAQIERLERRCDETYQWVADMGSVGVAI